MVAGDEIRLADIRTPGEIAGGVIPEAALLPMALVPSRIEELPRD